MIAFGHLKLVCNEEIYQPGTLGITYAVQKDLNGINVAFFTYLCTHCM